MGLLDKYHNFKKKGEWVNSEIIMLTPKRRKMDPTSRAVKSAWSSLPMNPPTRHISRWNTNKEKRKKAQDRKKRPLRRKKNTTRAKAKTMPRRATLKMCPFAAECWKSSVTNSRTTSTPSLENLVKNTLNQQETEPKSSTSLMTKNLLDRLITQSTKSSEPLMRNPSSAQMKFPMLKLKKVSIVIFLLN